jgi:hypothetical protein
MDRVYWRCEIGMEMMEEVQKDFFFDFFFFFFFDCSLIQRISHLEIEVHVTTSNQGWIHDYLVGECG